MAVPSVGSDGLGQRLLKLVDARLAAAALGLHVTWCMGVGEGVDRRPDTVIVTRSGDELDLYCHKYLTGHSALRTAAAYAEQWKELRCYESPLHQFVEAFSSCSANMPVSEYPHTCSSVCSTRGIEGVGSSSDLLRLLGAAEMPVPATGTRGAGGQPAAAGVVAAAALAAGLQVPVVQHFMRLHLAWDCNALVRCP